MELFFDKIDNMDWNIGCEFSPVEAQQHNKKKKKEKKTHKFNVFFFWEI